MPKTADQRQITVYLHRDHHRRLQAEARRRGQSLTQLCLDHLQPLLDRLEYQEPKPPDQAA